MPFSTSTDFKFFFQGFHLQTVPSSHFNEQQPCSTIYIIYQLTKFVRWVMELWFEIMGVNNIHCTSRKETKNIELSKLVLKKNLNARNLVKNTSNLIRFCSVLPSKFTVISNIKNKTKKTTNGGNVKHTF